jgi:hypothetical protein
VCLLAIFPSHLNKGKFIITAITLAQAAEGKRQRLGGLNDRKLFPTVYLP